MQKSIDFVSFVDNSLNMIIASELAVDGNPTSGIVHQVNQHIFNIWSSINNHKFPIKLAAY